MTSAASELSASFFLLKIFCISWFFPVSVSLSDDEDEDDDDDDEEVEVDEVDVDEEELVGDGLRVLTELEADDDDTVGFGRVDFSSELFLKLKHSFHEPNFGHLTEWKEICD